MRSSRARAWVVLATVVATVLLAAPASAAEPNRPPADVDVGVFVNGIHDVSLRDDRFTADLWVWFRWTDPELQPLETFEIVDATIEERQDVPVRFDGTTYYGEARVIASVNKLWDVSSFPLDDHVAQIVIEDSGSDERTLRYRADAANSNLDPAARTPSWDLAMDDVHVERHTYPTSYGDPTLSPGETSTYSRFVARIRMERHSSGYFWKLSFGLFTAVLVAFLALFMDPRNVEARVGVGVGALFAAVASLYVSSSGLPDTNVMTLADRLHIVGFVFIFLVLFWSTAAARLAARGRERAALTLDWTSIGVLLPGYFGVTALLVALR